MTVGVYRLTYSELLLARLCIWQIPSHTGFDRLTQRLSTSRTEKTVLSKFYSRNLLRLSSPRLVGKGLRTKQRMAIECIRVYDATSEDHWLFVPASNSRFGTYLIQLSVRTCGCVTMGTGSSHATLKLPGCRLVSER